MARRWGRGAGRLALWLAVAAVLAALEARGQQEGAPGGPVVRITVPGVTCPI